jgi:hypothetical protein
VLYVLSESDSPTSAGRVRPGVIVNLVDDGSVNGLVNLQVFTDGGFDQLPPVHHMKNVVHDEGSHAPGTWHWPPPRTLVFETYQQPAPDNGTDDVPLGPGSDPVPVHFLASPPKGFEKAEDELPFGPSSDPESR